MTKVGCSTTTFLSMCVTLNRGDNNVLSPTIHLSQDYTQSKEIINAGLNLQFQTAHR